jgi:predicted protein tyrosine phosphatase
MYHDRKIVVLPEFEVGRYLPTVPYIIVSITDPSKEAFIPPSRFKLGLLRLQFMDIDILINGFEDFHWYNGEMLTDLCMQESHAELVREFINTHKDKAELLIVHCRAGISRSPSMSFAICDALGLDRDIIEWWENWPHKEAPNRHVYELTKKAFQLSSTSQEVVGTPEKEKL